MEEDEAELVRVRQKMSTKIISRNRVRVHSSLEYRVPTLQLQVLVRDILEKRL